MSSDLISREEAIKALGDIHPLDYNAQAYKAKITAIPSADILEHARAIKEYCKEHTNCDGCPFEVPFEVSKDYRGTCKVSGVPEWWDLPEGEKGGVE